MAPIPKWVAFFGGWDRDTGAWFAVTFRSLTLAAKGSERQGQNTAGSQASSALIWDTSLSAWQPARRLGKGS